MNERNLLNPYILIYCRQFLDGDNGLRADQIYLYRDTSRNFNLGVGGICQNFLLTLLWDPEFMDIPHPSIEYLELYAVTEAVLKW